MANLDPEDRFLAAQAIYKKIGSQLRTGNPDNARGQYDAKLEGLYQQFGAKSIDLKIGDMKVGTASRSERKGAQKMQLEVVNEDSFTNWLSWNLTEFYPAILAQCAKEGIIPDGCAPVVQESSPSISWTLRGLDVDEVSDALKEKYGIGAPDISGLLEGGE